MAADSGETTLLLPHEDDTGPVKKPLSFSERHVIAVVSISFFAFVIGVALQDAPLTQTYEHIICKNYYSKSKRWELLPAEEIKELCKIAPIQAELAWIVSGVKLVEFLPTLCLAIPISRLSDQFGRRLYLIISFIGVNWQYLTIFTICWYSNILPLRLVFAAPFCTLLGGGATVAASAIFAIVSDVVPVESLTNHYYVLSAVNLTGIAIGRTASSFLMEWNVWSPLVIGNGTMFIGVLLCLALPETRFLRCNNASLLKNLEHPHDERLPKPQTSSPEDAARHVTIVQRALLTFKASKALILRRKFIVFVLLLEFFNSFAGTVNNFLLLYTSKRYNLPFAQANYFNTYLTTVNVVLLVLVLPSMSWLILTKLHVDPYRKEVIIALGSSVLYLAGSIVLGLGQEVVSAIIGITLFGLGNGTVSNLRSIMVLFAPPDQSSLCQTLFNLCRDLAEALSMLVYSAAFGKGVGLGGMWIGMPFQIAAAVFIFVSICLALILCNARPAPSDCSSFSSSLSSRRHSQS